MVSIAAFNREGEYAGRVITGTSGGVARVWDLGGRAWTPWLRHGGEITSAEATNNGRYLLTASRDRLVRVWDLVGGLEPYRNFSRTGLGSRSIVRGDYSIYWFTSTLDQNHRRVLVGGNCRSPARPCYAQLWDVDAGEPVTPRLFHKSLITAVALSPDSSKVASSSSDRTIRIWDATTGEPLTVLPIDGAASSLRFSPDSSRLVAAAGYWALPPAFSEARVWDLTTRRVLWSVRQGRVIWAAVFDPSGRLVATSGEDYQVMLREAGTGRVVGAPLVHPSRVSHLAFSADGRKLLTSGEDGGVRLWDVARQKLVLPPLMHTSTIISADFSPDGQAIVVATEGGTAQIWDAQTGRPRTPVLKHRGLVYSANMSSDGRFLATGSLDRTTRAWDATSGEPLTLPLRREGLVRSSVFLGGTGKWLVVGFGLDSASLPLGQSPPEQLENIAMLLAAHRLGERGELMALSAADLASAWEHVRGTGGTVPTPRQLEAWNRREARQDWQQTLRYLNGVIDSQTAPSASLVALRGETHAELGQWKEAVRDFATARRQQRWNTEVGYWLALAEVKGGDESASRRTVAELFAEFAGTRNAHRAFWLARTMILHPDEAHATRAEPLAALMFDVAPEEPEVLETYAATLLRRGAADQAIARLKRAIDIDQGQPTAWQAALLALAYRHQGRLTEARRVLRIARDESAAGRRPLQKRLRLAAEAPGATDSSTRWWQRVETELLLHEAEGLAMRPPRLAQRRPGMR
jgi:WD40 repeat protein/tetratricopeptide (TPR) repeat protein